MWDALRHARRFGRTVQLLLVNQLIINIGFYMLYPYLATHMTRDLQLDAWLVGLVLGAGNLSQQGLFLIGGSLGDRIGFKRVIVLGCAIRALGFLAFSLAQGFAGLLLAALLSGFAGALFNPAVRTLLAHEAGDQRVQAFALFNIAANAGLLLGPLLGLLLLRIDFWSVGLAASAVFGLLTLLQLRYLPRRDVPAGTTRPLLHDWREAFGNRAFVLFAGAMLGYFALYVQFYLGLPLGLQQTTGSDESVGAIFTLAALMSLAAQVRVTSMGQRRWTPAGAIARGLLMMGLAFVPLWLATPFFPLHDAAVHALLPELYAPLVAQLTEALNLAPALLATALLSGGSMLAQPFAMDMIPLLGRPQLLGTYFGVYYLALGVGGLVGNLTAGVGQDLAVQTGLVGLPWLLLLLVGCLSAAAIAVLERRGVLVPANPAGLS